MQLKSTVQVSTTCQAEITISLSTHTDCLRYQISLGPFSPLWRVVHLDWDQQISRDKERVELLKVLDPLVGPEGASKLLEDGLEFGRAVYGPEETNREIGVIRQLAKEAYYRYERAYAGDSDKGELREKWLEAHNAWIRAATGR